MSNLYIEVNDKLVKKINLITLGQNDEDDDDTKNNDETPNSYIDLASSNDESLFDYANIREIIQDKIDKTANGGGGGGGGGGDTIPILIRVKLLWQAQRACQSDRQSGERVEADVCQYR